MNRIILPSVLLLMGVTGEAMAACTEDIPNNYTQVTDLTGLLPDKTVCDGSPGNWKGQEWHSGSSGQAKNLIDYKHGLSSTNDPSAPIGGWSISGDTVTYGYYKDTNNPGAGTVTYSYTVWDKGDGTYDFCSGGALVTNVAIQPGQGACIGNTPTPITRTTSTVSSPVFVSSPVIVSPTSTNLSPTKENDKPDKQDGPIASPVKEYDKKDKKDKKAKPIAFPTINLPPVKKSDKQAKPDESPELNLPLTKEDNKQGKLR